MYHRKYGKLTPNAWLSCEMEQSNPLIMLTVGILLTVAGILVRINVGSPYRTILELGVGDMIPPAWLMAAAWTLSFFIVGCAGGFVFAYRTAGQSIEKYKGCMYFVLLCVLELCWYPTLFGKGFVFLSVLLCVLILCLSLVTTFCFYRVTSFSGMLMLFHDVWLIYMLLLNFAVLFRA